MLPKCQHSVYRLRLKKPLPWRVTGARVARHVERPRVRSKNVYIAEPAPELQPMCCEIGRPAPRDRRGVGRLPSRSALIWRTTRSRTGGAGAIETPTPGAVPDFIPVVGRYRTTATWRLSFHCGMNAADTSAWRGIRIGCASAPRLDAVRTSPRSCQATITRPHGSRRHLASLRVQASIERCIG